MAATKTTKTAKSAKVAKVSLAGKSIEELQKDLVTKQNDLLESRKGHRAGELVNPRAITMNRKQVARLKTAIRANELKGDK